MPVGFPGPGSPFCLGRSRPPAAIWSGLELAVAAAAVRVAGVRGVGRANGAKRERECKRDGHDLENTTDRHSVGLPTPPAISVAGPAVATIGGPTKEVKPD